MNVHGREQTSATEESAMAAQSALKASKKRLRELMTSQIAQVSGQSIATQSSMIAEKLLSMDIYKRARSISVYLSMPQGEVMTGKIVTDALGQQKEVFVPYIVPAKRASPEHSAFQRGRAQLDMVSLHSAGDFKECEENRDKWGIPSIRSKSLQERRRIFDSADTETDSPVLDLIVMPGLAFDPKCRRLGHGKGFYDEFLSRYRRLKVGAEGSNASMPALVGISLIEQLVPANEILPVTDEDWPLDALILGNGSVLYRSKGGMGESSLAVEPDSRETTRRSP